MPQNKTCRPNKRILLRNNSRVRAPWQLSATFHDFSVMFLQLLLFILRYPRVQATIEFSNTATSNSDLIPGLCPVKRTQFSIISSCLSTVFICAWTSVHPNVPPRNKWLGRLNRLKLMFWMIIAPELVLAWAVRQFFAAREIINLYNKSSHVGQGKC